VCSLGGVILIARPTFLFGDGNGAAASPDGQFQPVENGTSAERLLAVMYAVYPCMLLPETDSHFVQFCVDRSLWSDRNMYVFCFCLSMVLSQAFVVISMSAMGKRAHPMHIMSFFALGCVIIATVV
jgi:hypothetical protein